MADTKKKFGHALLQAFGLDDQRVKRLRLDIEAGDVPLLTVTVYPRDVSAQQIEAIATEYEIISRSELRDIRERLAAQQQAEPVQEPVAFDTAHAMRLADKYADLAADVRAAQGYPEHALAQDRKRMDEARSALEAYLSGQTKPKCNHCASPLFAAVQCRVCGRKAKQIDAAKGGGNG